MTRPRALVIDDEPDICELLTLTLGRMDIDTDTAEDVTGAKALLESRSFDLYLTDMRLPDRDGLELVEWMQVERPGVPVAVITAHGNVETAVRALKLGAFDFVSKPVVQLAAGHKPKPDHIEANGPIFVDWRKPDLAMVFTGMRHFRH